jgi:hypothetical protein
MDVLALIFARYIDTNIKLRFEGVFGASWFDFGIDVQATTRKGHLGNREGCTV